MGLSDALSDLFIFCAKKDIVFRYLSSESENNKIEINKEGKEVTITIVDPEDEGFVEKVKNLKETLEELFH